MKFEVGTNVMLMTNYANATFGTVFEVIDNQKNYELLDKSGNYLVVDDSIEDILIEV